MTAATTTHRPLAAWALAVLLLSDCTDLETHSELDSGLGIGTMAGEGGAVGGASAGTSGVTGGSTSGGSGGAAGALNTGGFGGVGAIGVGAGGAGAVSGPSGGIGATPTCPDGQRPCAGECLSEDVACTGQCPDGSHDCSGVCISNASVNGCGADSCSACSVPTFSEATCDGTSCDFECDATHKKCAQECIDTAACCDAAECSGGSDCVGHQCTCPASTKTCGSGAALRCVDGSCCGDADCSNGFACVSGSCKSFCQQQTRPGDVLASDYQCQDFDTTTSLPWPTTLVSGTAATSSSRASSLPRSFKSSYTSNANDDATGVMTWQAVGANEILTANVVLRIQPELLPSPQPSYGGYIDLMCLQSPTFLQCLSFTNRGTLLQSGAPPITNYTGYFVHKEISGGAFVSFDCPLTGTLTANTWNTVEYDARADGHVTFNGVNAGACAGYASGTMTSLILGLREQNSAASGWAVYYDNVVVSMRR